MIERLQKPELAADLFKGWEETLIWSCLQNVMGDIYIDTDGSLDSAMAMIGDFCFFAGKPNQALVQAAAEKCQKNYLIMTPQNRAWEELLETCYGSHVERQMRYAIKKEPDVFERRKLQAAVDDLPYGYQRQLIDEKWYNECLKNAWSEDLVSQYSTYEMYRLLGFGVVAVREGEIVAGASSYTSYREGIEIEIDTREDHRRKGLAYACGARLILECLDRGRYPSWDAQNLWSVGLAEKLGYHFEREYPVYVWKG